MADKLETIQIQFVQRNARKSGITSSEDFNDMMTELGQDIANVNNQWNNRLVGLTNTIPDGTDDVSIDAFTNGLSGRHLYTDSTASATSNSNYFNTTQTRPLSILEQFQDVYNELSTTKSELEQSITDSIPTAAEVEVVDAGGLLVASNVEDALAEIQSALNSAIISGGGGSGNITKVGTPVDNEIGVWTGNGTLEGHTNFTWNGSQLNIESSNNLSSGSNFTNRIAAASFGVAGSGAILIDGNQIEQADAGNSLFLNSSSSSDVYLCNGGGQVGVNVASVVNNTIMQIAKGAGTVPDLSASTVLALTPTTGTSASSILAIIAGTAGSSGITFGDNASSTTEVRGYIQYKHSSDSMAFRTAGTEGMTIDSNQNVSLYSKLRVGDNTAPSNPLELVLATNDLSFIDADDTGSTSIQDGYIEVVVNGSTKYIPLYDSI